MEITDNVDRTEAPIPSPRASGPVIKIVISFIVTCDHINNPGLANRAECALIVLSQGFVLFVGHCGDIFYRLAISIIYN